MLLNISGKKSKKHRLSASCAAALCLMTAAVCALPAAAADNVVNIEELSNMSITLPDDVTAATRESGETDIYFSLFGLNYDSTMNNFESNDIYLQGMDENADVTITVTMTENTDSESIGSYNQLSSDKLNEVISNFLMQDEYISCTADEAGNLTWLLFEVNVSDNNGGTIKAYQANTGYDGMSVNITLQHNDGDVTAEDYSTFSAIVSSVTFDDSLITESYIIYMCIGVGLLVAVVIIMLVLVTKKSKNSAENKNKRILEELADKYSSDSSDDEEKYEDIEGYVFNGTQEAEEPKVKIYERPSAKNDELIDKIVSETLNNRYEGEPISAADMKAEESEKIEETEKAEKTEGTPQEDSDLIDISSLPPSGSEKPSHTEHNAGEDFEEEYEEGFDNDEELLRAQAKTKFDDSDDFFEEAPKKAVGIIDSRELKNAEDYDVIAEEEKRAARAAERREERRPKPKKKKASALSVIAAGLVAVGGGLKSFGVHTGYFFTNLSRMIKRRNALKKRKKAEEERLERERRRSAARSRQRRETQAVKTDNGLVRVHSSTQRRPPQSSRTRSSSQARRQGSSSKNARAAQNRNTNSRKTKR